MVEAYQRSLFEEGAIVGGQAFGRGLLHVELGDGAWVEHCEEWVAGAGELFDRLTESVPWKAEERPMYDRVVAVPRLVAFYGEDDPPAEPVLADLRSALNTRYGDGPAGPLRSTGLCLYRDNRDSVAWHGDRIARNSSDPTIVAIVSLGVRRRLLLRRRQGGPSRRFELGGGDLLVMGGTCQRTWEHAVPKSRRPSGPRISVQFRSAGAA